MCGAAGVTAIYDLQHVWVVWEFFWLFATLCMSKPQIKKTQDNYRVTVWKHFCMSPIFCFGNICLHPCCLLMMSSFWPHLRSLVCTQEVYCRGWWSQDYNHQIQMFHYNFFIAPLRWGVSKGSSRDLLTPSDWGGKEGINHLQMCQMCVSLPSIYFYLRLTIVIIMFMWFALPLWHLLDRWALKELEPVNLHRLKCNSFVLEEICFHLFIGKVNYTSDASHIKPPLW